MWWWVWGIVAVLLVATYLSLLAARVNRLHRRASTATAALDASLVRRAAAAAVLAEELAVAQPSEAADLYAAARAALDAEPAEREAAENDLTLALRRLPDPDGVTAWTNVVTASRRVGLARQVHTDVVRDARAVRRRVPVRALGLSRRHGEPAYFDVDDPTLAPLPAEQDRATQS
jgi:Tfp pilus assembly protein PilX